MSPAWVASSRGRCGQQNSIEWPSFGAESAGGAPLSAATPIYTASIVEQFTDAVIAGLVLDGTLQLTQSSARWLPEAPSWWQPITVEHLMCHTAGLAPRTVDERNDLARSNRHYPPEPRPAEPSVYNPR